MSRPSLPTLLLAVPAFTWSGWFLWSAFGRWSFERVCKMACGPVFPAEQADYYRRAFDWQTPLIMAADGRQPLERLTQCLPRPLA
jgi:hypothetical protein